MKFVSLLFILLFSVSCGKIGGTGSSTSNSPKEGGCDLNGRAVACESMQGADGLGVDLLDSMIDVPVKIQDADITFLTDKQAMSQGRRINCRVAVKEGEVYRFALRGDKLLLMTKDGSFEMQRLNEGESDRLIGAWVWDGYVDQGTHMIRQITFLSRTRVVLKNKCEL